MLNAPLTYWIQCRMYYSCRVGFILTQLLLWIGLKCWKLMMDARHQVMAKAHSDFVRWAKMRRREKIYLSLFGDPVDLQLLTLWVQTPYMARCTTLCDKVCQWLETGWWFSLGTTVSYINKTDHHDITEILLKMALNTINLTFHI